MRSQMAHLDFIKVQFSIERNFKMLFSKVRTSQAFSDLFSVSR